MQEIRGLSAMTYRCPKCGEACTRLYFDFRDHIIFCNVCKDRITEFILEEDKDENEQKKERTTEDSERA